MSATVAGLNLQADIEVDAAIYENDDSDYASSGFETSTQSLTSSVNQYIFENGRRYHSYYGPEKNYQPTDETEQDRLDLHHEIFLLLLDGELHLAPIADSPQRILDIGTGTGIWAIDMADKHPSAEVVGTDLSPIQPNWVPPNCKFEVDDAEQDWTYADDHFDFIHARNIAQGVSNWTKVMSEMYRTVKPGGWVELAELGSVFGSDDGSLKPDNPMLRVWGLFDEALVTLGRPMPDGDTLRERLEEAGFVDVVVTPVKQPFGPWPKDKRLKKAATMALLCAETGVEAYCMALYTRVLKMSSEEAKQVCDATLRAHKDKRTHMYNYLNIAYGRKPE
ncbi:S-adenosyl-L-methionine-dependent methyltransferase [Sphaerosporella brunnea]|uniref:S-adenosyl-L-methionine-dependent methyltransferase n=1 Tax=Sphaerosporella brunnea TaxID=1250544 RepID=A0A5J5F9I3_9PEZI|nr:S-adenosyl-L-methionine-dependent methyltransferase [Sphaerosporella brunnea]